MGQLALIGSKASVLKSLKAKLIRWGFRVQTLTPEECSALESEEKGQWILGLMELNGALNVSDEVEKIKQFSQRAQLPLILLLSQKHLSELPSLSGVEDFLVMPAAPEQLKARIRFVLSRLDQALPGAEIQVGDLEIDPDRYEIRLAGEPLELTFKEFELLKFLATRPHRVFSRDQLLNQVWGYDFIGGTRTVDVHIRRLRAKLGPQYASLIATVRNVGYKFLASL